MLFTPRESLEDSIVRILSKDPYPASELYKKIKAEGKTVTIQAVYKALRFLISSAVIIKTSKNLIISQEWVDTIIVSLKGRSFLPLLTDKESASYDFKSLPHLDAYWKHLSKILIDQNPGFPVFIYNSYLIWHHITERLESEITYFKSFQKQKQYGFIVAANNSTFDKTAKTAFQNNYLQFDLWHKTSFNLTDYITVLGDFIVTTKLSKKLTSLIINIYSNAKTEQEYEIMLRNALLIPQRSKIKIEKNHLKAVALRKKLYKHFHIPQTIIKKYKLFT